MHKFICILNQFPLPFILYSSTETLAPAFLVALFKGPDFTIHDRHLQLYKKSLVYACYINSTTININPYQLYILMMTNNNSLDNWFPHLLLAVAEQFLSNHHQFFWQWIINTHNFTIDWSSLIHSMIFFHWLFIFGFHITHDHWLYSMWKHNVLRLKCLCLLAINLCRIAVCMYGLFLTLAYKICISFNYYFLSLSWQ